MRVAGRLTDALVPELVEACPTGVHIELDLADLVSADAAGIEALQGLRDRGAVLASAAGYLQLKLDSQPRRPVPAPQDRKPGEGR